MAVADDEKMAASGELERQLDALGLFEEQDPAEVQEAILRRIMAADSPEEILAPQGTVKAKDLLGRPIDIMGFRMQRSDLEEGPGFYAVIDAVDPFDQKPMVISCGAANVMVQLLALHKLKAFPTQAKFTEAERKTKNGYKPISLVAAPHG